MASTTMGISHTCREEGDGGGGLGTPAAEGPELHPLRGSWQQGTHCTYPQERNLGDLVTVGKNNHQVTPFSTRHCHSLVHKGSMDGVKTPFNC